MRKTLRIISVFVIGLIFLSGCLPQLKDPSEFSIPTWKPTVVLPIVKGSVTLGDALKDVGELIVDQETNIYTYQFNQDPADLEQISLPALELKGDALAIDVGEVWSQGAISVNSGIADVPFNYELIDTSDDPIAPTNVEMKLSDHGKSIDATLFTRAKLSDASTNVISFDIQTDEPFDNITITLIDTLGNQVGHNIITITNIGDIDRTNPVIPDTPQTPGGIFSTTETISLQERDIPSQLDFKIELTAHSTKGSIDVTVSVSNQLEIVELEGFDPANVGLKIPEITIPDIVPLASMPGMEATIESGRILLTTSTTQADAGNLFPFVIQLNEITLDEHGDGSSVSADLIKTDGADTYIDLAGLTINSNSKLTGSVAAVFAAPLIYDVWDDAKAQIVDYSYSVDLTMENIVAESITGDISKFLPDPNPITPEWDFSIEDINTSIQEVPYPEGLPEKIPGIGDIYLSMGINNNTGFEGNFTLGIAVYEDLIGTPKLDDNGDPIAASFALDINPREEYNFALKDEADYDKFIGIINSLPKYFAFNLSGGFTTSGNITMTSSDYIQPTYLSIDLPLSLAIPAGGITSEDIFEEVITYESDQLNTAKTATKYLKTSSLHIKYNNQASLGAGTVFHFTTPEGKTEDISLILKPEATDEIVLGINSDLADILANETGYTITCDLVLPNESDESYKFSLKSTDQLSFTIWMETDINVSEM